MNVMRLALTAAATGAALSFVAGHCSDAGTASMVLVEGGSFEMGDVFDEGVRFAAPVHEVTVSSFYLGKYEVTVEEFAAFVKDASYVTSAEKESKDAAARAGDEYNARLASRGAFVLSPTKDGMFWVAEANWRDPRYEQSPKDPVTCVSWSDAVSYCNWLSTREGLSVEADPSAYGRCGGCLHDRDDRAKNPTIHVGLREGRRRGSSLLTAFQWTFRRT